MSIEVILTIIFCATGIGVLHTLGEDIFDTLFHIKVRQPISLTFAIDYSGSMSGEIAEVKEHAWYNYHIAFCSTTLTWITKQC
jgi:hypothetical protein